VGSYVNSHLDPGETIAYEGSLHWIIYLTPVILLGLAIGLAISGLLAGALALLVIGLIGLLSSWVRSSLSTTKKADQADDQKRQCSGQKSADGKTDGQAQKDHGGEIDDPMQAAFIGNGFAGIEVTVYITSHDSSLLWFPRPSPKLGAFVTRNGSPNHFVR